MNPSQNQAEIPEEGANNEFMGERQDPNLVIAENHENGGASVMGMKPDKSMEIKGKKEEAKKYVKGVEDNPEYFRVDFQITHKLYEIYRRVKIVASEQYQSSSFEEKDQGNNTINYHKIMQIFKDINFKLEINQKLQILRAIKKFCFNQNFINQDEFTKIFKVIVHGIGIKETLFKPLIAAKYPTVVEKDARNASHKKAVSIKINKNFGKKLKTEQPQMQASQIKSQFTQLIQEQRSFQTVATSNKSYLKKIPAINPSTAIDEMQGSTVKSARKNESRRRMLTEVNRYEAERGYLNRAIQKNKVGKLTWENLFKMNEDTMHSYISIPSFVNQDLNLNDLDM